MSVEQKWRSLDRAMTQKIMRDEITISASDGFPLIKFFNPHIPNDELDALIAKAKDTSTLLKLEDFPDGVPLFHSRSPSKGIGSFYAQLKAATVKNIYLHQASALFHYFEEFPQAQTGRDVHITDDPQASHIMQGFPLATRNFNPRHLIFETGIMNRSRWFCCLHMAGLLKDRFKVEREEEIARAMGGNLGIIVSEQQEEADGVEDAGVMGSIATGVFMGSQQSQSSAPFTYAEAEQEMRTSCMRVHTPHTCIFYDPKNLEAISGWIGDTRKQLSSPAAREAVKSSFNATIESFLPIYAGVVTSPSPVKRRRVGVNV